MIWIESNASQVAKRIRKALSATMQDPFIHQERYRSIMADGTRKHFSRLGGGGSDASALGGIVSWSTSRHWATLATRRDSGYPLLVNTGAMARAWSNGSQASASSFRDGSRVTLLSPGGREGEKGRINQLGGRVTLLGESFRVPARQFRYWDSFMARDVVKQLRRAWEANA